MESTSLALIAKLMISVGCQNTNLTYKSACSNGSEQVINHSQIKDLSDQKELEIKVKAEDFARIYVFPYLSKDTFAVTVGSIDALIKKEITYTFRPLQAENALVKISQDSLAFQINWRF